MKKKIFLLIGIFAIGLLSGVFANSAFRADTVFDGPGLEGGLQYLKTLLLGTGIDTSTSLIGAILFWVRILLIIAGTLAFVGFIWAGVLYVTTFASEENSEKAKKIMMYTGIGIIVILFSYALTNFFINAAV
ncbi:hypothetical protein HZA38_05940 [Candidatus Peregrinibacteria bacterium]|nr:hypothetical protein [Candidatus Peregrinibacteria bacterium]